MNSIEKAREKRKYYKGDVHTKAVANLEKQKASPLVEIQDRGTGQVSMMKKCVADIMKAKGKVMCVKKSFSVPDFPDGFWSN